MKPIIKKIVNRIKRFSDFSDTFYLLAKNNPCNNTFNVATKCLVRYQGKTYIKNIQKIYKKFLSGTGVEMQELYISIHHKIEYSSASNQLDNTEVYYKSLFQIPVEPSISSSEFNFAIKACLSSIKYLCQEFNIPDFKHTNAIYHGLNYVKKSKPQGMY